jgi:DNA-binding Lrp family transcriptional regulator
MCALLFLSVPGTAGSHLEPDRERTSLRVIKPGAGTKSDRTETVEAIPFGYFLPSRKGIATGLSIHLCGAGRANKQALDATWGLVPPPTGLDDGRWEEGTMVAYILIQTEVGVAGQVAAEVAEAKGVKSAEGVTGPYDVIARAEAADLDELGKLVVGQIQSVAGVTRTLTCPVVHM